MGSTGKVSVTLSAASLASFYWTFFLTYDFLFLSVDVSFYPDFAFD